MEVVEVVVIGRNCVGDRGLNRHAYGDKFSILAFNVDSA